MSAHCLYTSKQGSGIDIILKLRRSARKCIGGLELKLPFDVRQSQQ